VLELHLKLSQPASSKQFPYDIESLLICVRFNELTHQILLKVDSSGKCRHKGLEALSRSACIRPKQMKQPLLRRLSSELRSAAHNVQLLALAVTCTNYLTPFARARH
jgi:hypothetical protein